MVIQSWMWRGLRGPAGLHEPQCTINVETGAQQPANGEGEVKDTAVNSLPPWEKAGGSRAHPEGRFSARFQEPYHGGNPWRCQEIVVRVVVTILIEHTSMAGSVLNALPTTPHMTLTVLSGVIWFL